MQLFCIPYAGGSAMMYLPWRKFLKENIIVIPLELAGRGKRFCEKEYDNFNKVVDDLYYQIKKKLDVDQPYAIFGHSMGCWIAYELGCKLINSNEVLHKPIHLFFSGNYVPHKGFKEKGVSNLPDEDFWDYIYSKGGMIEEVYHDQEFKSVYLDIIRSDYQLLEQYNPCQDNKMIFPCNISIMNGQDDEIGIIDAKEWSIYAGNNIKIKWFKGGHFYFTDKVRETTEYINFVL